MNKKYHPEPDELPLVKTITAKFGDTTFIRVSYNMLLKHHIDANKEFRAFLKTSNFFDYDTLVESKKVIKKINVINSEGLGESIISFNRSSNRKLSQGDPRFWIPILKKESKESNLLVFFCFDSELYITNINIWASADKLEYGLTLAVENSFSNVKSEVISLFTRVVHRGWIKSVSSVVRNDKDPGDTFENAMGTKANSSRHADYKGKIEYKTKGEKSKTADSCFNRIPDPEISPLRTTKEIILKYGIDEKNTMKYPGYKSLFDEVSTDRRNRFFLEVDEINEVLVMRHYVDGVVCRWYFRTLKDRLEKKHPSTLWVNYKERMNELGQIQFMYTSASLTRKADFVAFIQLIADGKARFCWRARVKKDGTGYDDHGNGFRYGPKYRRIIFGDAEKIKIETIHEYEDGIPKQSATLHAIQLKP